VGADEGGAGVGKRLIGVDGDGGGRGNVDGLLDFCVRRKICQLPTARQPKSRKEGSRRSRGKRTSQTLQLECFDLCNDVVVLVRRQVVVLNEVDNVRQGEHASEAMRCRVVERGRNHAVRDERLQTLRDTELVVENDEPEEREGQLKEGQREKDRTNLKLSGKIS
jgi:hypothetical protein